MSVEITTEWESSLGESPLRPQTPSFGPGNDDELQEPGTPSSWLAQEDDGEEGERFELLLQGSPAISSAAHDPEEFLIATPPVGCSTYEPDLSKASRELLKKAINTISERPLAMVFADEDARSDCGSSVQTGLWEEGMWDDSQSSSEAPEKLVEVLERQDQVISNLLLRCQALETNALTHREKFVEAETMSMKLQAEIDELRAAAERNLGGPEGEGEGCAVNIHQRNELRARLSKELDALQAATGRPAPQGSAPLPASRSTTPLSARARARGGSNGLASPVRKPATRPNASRQSPGLTCTPAQRRGTVRNHLASTWGGSSRSSLGAVSPHSRQNSKTALPPASFSATCPPALLQGLPAAAKKCPRRTKQPTSPSPSFLKERSASSTLLSPRTEARPRARVSPGSVPVSGVCGPCPAAERSFRFVPRSVSPLQGGSVASGGAPAARKVQRSSTESPPRASHSSKGFAKGARHMSPDLLPREHVDPLETAHLPVLDLKAFANV
uniref:Uncharacterized protein n=1 Tax=Noctiluca scintillans TaxID=2966 RepID=A0A7S1AEE9_NOCSC